MLFNSAPSLLSDADFRRLWIAQTASQFGAQAGQVTLPLIAVIGLDAGAGELGALRAVQQIPVLLLSLIIGAWVDRHRVRDTLLRADLGRFLAFAAIPIAYLLGILGLPELFACAFLVGIGTVCFDVAYQAALVRMVPTDRLAQGNSMLESSRSAAQIGGPALGGGMVSLLSAPIAMTASAGCFGASFLALRRIRRTETVPEASGGPAGIVRQIRQGLRYVARHSALRAVGVGSAGFQLFFAAFMTVNLLFLPRTLHLSGTAVGLTLAALGPGSLVGSLLSARLPRRFGYGAVLVVAAAIADGVLLAGTALHGSGAGTIGALLIINFVFGALGQTVDVAVMAVRQALTPAAMQGRVAATLHFAGMGMTPLGSLLGGLLAMQCGLRSALVIAASGLLISPLSMALSPLVRIGRTLPRCPVETAPDSVG